MSEETKTENEYIAVDPIKFLKHDTSLFQGETEEMDYSNPDEAFEFAPPPPKGSYDLKPVIAKDGIKVNTKRGNYLINLECRISSDDRDTDDYPVFAMVSTGIGRGKRLSTCMAFLAKLGIKNLPTKLNDFQQVEWLLKALKQEPTIKKCELDWEAQIKVGEKKYETVCKTMDDFPKDADGKPMHEFSIPRAGGIKETVKARMKVVTWGGIGAGKKVEKKSNFKAVSLDTESEVTEEDVSAVLA